MQVGEQYALRWPKYPHLLDATVLELGRNGVVCEVVHRCTLGCYVKQMKALPIDGRMTYDYYEFGKMFVWRNPDAIALPA